MDITSKQLLVLDFIKRFIASKGYSPTVREIAEGLYLKSPSTVQEHLKNLVAAGLITIDKRKSRTIELLVQNEYLNTSDKIVSIPILGKRSDAVTKEYMEVPVSMLNNYDAKNLYIYKKGKSVFIVNTGLTKSGKPSIVLKNSVYELEETPKGDIFANIVSEFRLY